MPGSPVPLGYHGMVLSVNCFSCRRRARSPDSSSPSGRPGPTEGFEYRPMRYAVQEDAPEELGVFMLDFPDLLGNIVREGIHLEGDGLQRGVGANFGHVASGKT